ncbi:hypothetical protein COLO4_35318 [Corchorus olitorius]|uniref:Uncharacterized protein n=1 Tax=Corchorus olitorius TaxID=93759 RepID=A0A1R3GHM8_9ROSI|nr:hypothetical protein COLO4_35318 [Corchorus olitorius]
MASCMGSLFILFTALTAVTGEKRVCPASVIVVLKMFKNYGNINAILFAQLDLGGFSGMEVMAIAITKIEEQAVICHVFKLVVCVNGTPPSGATDILLQNSEGEAGGK